MKTWLFTWNPNRWAWDDKYNGYEEMINQIAQAGKAFSTWSCGVNKSIQESLKSVLNQSYIERD